MVRYVSEGCPMFFKGRRFDRDDRKLENGDDFSSSGGSPNISLYISDARPYLSNIMNRIHDNEFKYIVQFNT